MRLHTNTASLLTLKVFNKTSSALTNSTVKLSSGVRINSAKDDATGLAISNKLRTQSAALELASRNSLEGVSLVQTAEGALTEVTNMLQRMRELAVQSANDTLTDDDRAVIQVEIDNLVEEVDGVASRTEYNQIKLFTPVDRTAFEESLRAIEYGDAFDSSLNEGTDGYLEIVLQVGPNSDMEITTYIAPTRSDTLGLINRDGTNKINYLTVASCTDAITRLDDAINQINDTRGNLGAVQNRLEYTINNLDNTALNIETARSRIEDTDMAIEMSEYTTLNVLSQASIAILTQSNQRPSQILSLFQ